MKNLKLRIVLISILSIITLAMHSQVTVGDATAPQSFSVLEISSEVTTGGLRLPQLTTAQRETLTDAAFKANNKAPGLAIYNLSTDCYEYWNGIRWVSLCEGNSQMTINPAPCDAVNADGTGCDMEFTVSDPDCLAGPFSFTIVAGSDYASLLETNEAEGSFKLSFLANNSINIRSVIVRVTSNCTSLYKDFLFTQLGQSCDSNLGVAPVITSIPAAALNELNFCSGGAVYLSVPSDTENLDELIWTRNGVEVARGVNHITVTQTGIYDVWMGIVGCHQRANNAITVKKSGTGAPAPVEIVVKGNNGVVCSSAQTTTLIAQNPSSGGTVRWFKNGVLQDLTSPDNRVEAGVGQWFAVVNDGTCWSKPSETANVIEEGNTGDPLTEPVIENSAGYCAGSTIQLSVSDLTYDPTYTYTWYQNNDQLGTGRYIMYTVPTASSVVIRCRATKAGSCAVETIGTESITIGTIPARPSITGNTVLCSGTATLNVISASPGSYTYAWYKDSQLIGTSQSITVTSGDDYYASVTEVGGCTSPLAKRSIPDLSSAIPTVTLASSNLEPNQNDIVTYVASIDFNPATAYNWTITNATLQSGGGNTPNAIVKFNQLGTASVSVEVTNACGTGGAISNIPSITPACADPIAVYPSTATALSTVAGTARTLGPISATFSSGAPTPKYQWYRNNVLIPGANGNSYIANESTVGTYTYYCEVSNYGCPSATKNSGTYTLTVDINPGTLPLGSGTFTGKTCFDINKSNFDTDCGTESVRADYATNFATLGAVTYTFTASPSGTKTNLRFIVVDQEDVIANFTANNISGTIANNQTATLVINYKTTLSSESGPIYGRTRDQAAMVKLYAVYNNGSIDVSIPIIVNIQDCACCGGAQQIGNGTYLTRLYGTDCWMVENSKEGSASATYFGENISTTTITNGSTYRPSTINGQHYYGDGNRNSACPAGWHMPTFAEATNLINAVYPDISQNNGANGAKWWAGPSALWLNSTNPNAALTGGAFYYNSGGYGYQWRYWSQIGYWWLSDGRNLKGDSSYLGTETGRSTMTFLPVRCVQNK